MNRAILVPAFFFAALLFLFAQLYEILASFLKPIAWSILLVVVFEPVHVQALRLTGGRRAAAAALVTLAIVLLVAIPVTVLSGVLAHEATSLFEAISRLTDSGALAGLAERFEQSAPGRLLGTYAPHLRGLQIDLTEVGKSTLAAAGNLVVTHVGGVAKNVAALVLNLFVVLFTVFFLFRDGGRMYETVHDLIPMEAAAKASVLARLRQTLEAVVRGMVITAAVQGLLTGIGLTVAGVPFAAFLAVLAGVLSLLPFGAAAVWVSCTIYLFVAGSVGRGLFLGLWGALVVSTVDNFIRPMVVGSQARLPTLLLFFGMIGGLEAYGFLGLFLGPALLAALAGFIEIYREEYGASPPAALDAPPAGVPPEPGPGERRID